MGQPAARLGDPTAHGGVIVVGFPMVLIGGMPAARIGDMHICPMLNPGVPPPPHVGGPVVLGSPMVLIGGAPAARMGDMLVCAGPPDSIIMGCPTVLIGSGGSGSGSGGGASAGAPAADTSGKNDAKATVLKAAKAEAMLLLKTVLNTVGNPIADLASSAVQMAAASAGSAVKHYRESSTKEGFWLEFEFTDKAGTPVSGINYELTHPDNQHSLGTLGSDGYIRRDGQQGGQGTAKIVNLSNAKWSKEITKPGDSVKLSVQAQGFEDGTASVITIYRKNINGSEKAIKNIETVVKANKVESEVVNDFETASPENNPDPRESVEGYYFECRTGQNKAVSALLYIEDFLELELKDSDGRPLANEEYILFLPNGKVESGKLDSNGYRKIEKIPAGKYSLRLPGLIRQPA